MRKISANVTGGTFAVPEFPWPSAALIGRLQLPLAVPNGDDSLRTRAKRIA
jgi:hypothetical protein